MRLTGQIGSRYGLRRSGRITVQIAPIRPDRGTDHADQIGSRYGGQKPDRIAVKLTDQIGSQYRSRRSGRIAVQIPRSDWIAVHISQIRSECCTYHPDQIGSQ